MGKRYRTSYEIPFYETDVNHCAKLPHLLAVALQVSGMQSAELGMSDQYVLATYGLVWVITDYDISIERLPKFAEKITIETEAKSYNKLFCYRDFDILGQDGQKIMTIATTFVLIDFKTRKVAPVPADLIDVYDSEFIKKIKRGPKYPLLENADKKDYHVRYFDLDMNGHVNNSKYFDWIYDVMPIDFLKGHYPKHIALKYVKEIHYGHDIVSEVLLEDKISRHQITTDGQVNAQAILEWGAVLEEV
ncbi:acyl-ACP thioesterase domain-containing protein [Streptococcus thoraltensis]|uniref:acyl-ACP thioesterase domain-containing protein n=1 Tax=Streptococcus thoraltensis TaxID=55085 RepID=UPI001F55EF01|nr:acyl-ACP thioesterase domain-containing protein [Streptococcus thoraltensis]